MLLESMRATALEMHRRQMTGAANRYVELVRDAPDERAWLAEWEHADLTGPALCQYLDD
jgi:hypothetical protein